MLYSRIQTGGEVLEREQLERLLGGGDEASLAAPSALRAGASHVVWDGTTSAESLATVYGRRLRHTLRRGRETSGLARAGGGLCVGVFTCVRRRRAFEAGVAPCPRAV
ncbi:hypothetical protein SGFS_058420 [Streptomyces graminofaciens]|uniref:Uncharacterized protein n=1 Tax=Streptomyces graminofaciens TaxID=68212 RepID=A0ABN5VN22_9ACTN|nr:hypothetical protein SGFS_058420 [Streptomyces graminofaciens]